MSLYCSASTAKQSGIPTHACKCFQPGNTPVEKLRYLGMKVRSNWLTFKPYFTRFVFRSASGVFQRLVLSLLVVCISRYSYHNFKSYITARQNKIILVLRSEPISLVRGTQTVKQYPWVETTFNYMQRQLWQNQRSSCNTVTCSKRIYLQLNSFSNMHTW